MEERPTIGPRMLLRTDSVCQTVRPMRTGRVRLPALRRLALGAALLAAYRAEAQVLSGSVRQALTDRVLAGVSVSLLDERDSTLRSTTTNLTGAFRFTGLAPGTYSLSLRAIAHEPLLTTPFRVGATDTVVLAFRIQPTAVGLDTVRATEAKSILSVTRGRAQFMEHYRRGIGLFISGAEIEATKKGVAEYVSQLPGFSDYAGGNPAATNALACQNLNAVLTGRAPTVTTERRSTARSNGLVSGDFCSLTDERGRRVFSVDAPCVVSQVDRIGLVKRVDGTDLIVQPQRHLYTPDGSFLMSEPEPGAVAGNELVVHLHDVIGVEFFRSPAELPERLRIRGNSPEAEAMMARCGHIQFWTRSAW